MEAEAVLDTCRANVEDPTVATNHLQVQEAYDALKLAEQQVERLYARWAELEGKLHGAHE